MNEVIESTEAFVKSRLFGEGTGHDWWHAHRVRNTALTLQASEGGDRLVVELAALLHDIGDRKVLHADDDDPTIALNFLRSIQVGHEAIQAVSYVIANLSYSKSLDQTSIEKPIELQIVQDADRLDALGAIGIARAFAFGGSGGRLLYDPLAAPQTFTSSEAYKQANGSTLHHFDEKLFLLKDTFNTEAARRVAQERDAYMHEFYERFIAEWDGQR
jgi:uncharacterized protein